MRRAAILTGLGLLFLAAGCKPRELNPSAGDPVSITTEKPTVEQLVGYLNTNAHGLQSIKAGQVAIDCKQGSEGVGLVGSLSCAKPRNFRLRAQVALQTVDVGSNDDEFWYYISKDNPPYVNHCSYQDMAGGKVQLPFPFQPDMVVDALGMGEYDPKKDYKLQDDGRTVSLIEPAVSAQGQPVQHVVVFSRVKATGTKPLVLAHILLDGKGNEICRASILEVQSVQVDPNTPRAVVPTRMQLSWKQQQIEMTMRLYDPEVNVIDPQRAAKVFSRRDLADKPSFDMAQGRLDQPTGFTQSNVIQRISVPAPK